MVCSHVTKGSLLRTYLEFYFAKQRGGLDPLSLNDQEKGNPPEGNSCHMPGESLHAAAPSQCLVIITIIIINIIIIILLLITIIIRLEIRIFHDFSTSIFQVPKGAMKVTGSSIHRYRKKETLEFVLTLIVFFSPARCVCLTMYTSKWLFQWTKWWATMDIVGCSLFGSRYLRSSLNVQFHAPPKWTLVTCLVSLFTQQPLRSVSSSSPSSSSTSSSSSPSSSPSSFDLKFGFFMIFRHPFSKYPTVRWKWQVRASIGTAKRDIGVCANTDRVFFPPHDACVWQCIPPNGYLNGLSDEQPWTWWGALFSDPDTSALLWMSSSMPPPSELSSHALCVSSRSSPFAVSHHQHDRHHPHHHHHHSTWNSDLSTSIFQVPHGAMKVTGSSIHRYRKKRHWSLC